MRISRRRALTKFLLGASASLAIARHAHADTATYTYDALGRVVGVTYSDGSSIAYTYDAAGNRTQVVQANPAAPAATFSANPTSIAPGASSTLSWTSSNATSLTIDNGVGAVTPVGGGSVNVSPATTTTYTATISGPGGATVRQATVTVA